MMELKIFGYEPVLEALKSPKVKLNKIYLTNRNNKEIEQLIANIKPKLSIELVTLNTLNKEFAGFTHQGFALSLHLSNLHDDVDGFRPSNKGQDTVLILDHIQDPQNFGAILRSACFFGVSKVVFPKDRACPITSQVAKASSGALFHLDLCRVTNLSRAVDVLKENGYWLAGLDPNGSKSLDQVDLKPLALALGHEGEGLSKLIKSKCDLLVSIHRKSSFDSLNVAQAATVAMYALTK